MPHKQALKTAGINNITPIGNEPLFGGFLCFLLTRFVGYGSNTIDVNKRFVAGIADIMGSLRGDIGNFALPDLVAVIFANQQLSPAGKENQQFLAVLCAMLAAGLTGRQINPARAHTTCLRLAGQEPLVFGILVQIDYQNFF